MSFAMTTRKSNGRSRRLKEQELNAMLSNELHSLQLEDENRALRVRVKELVEWKARASKTMSDYAPKREKVRKAHDDAKRKLKQVKELEAEIEKRSELHKKVANLEEHRAELHRRISSVEDARAQADLDLRQERYEHTLTQKRLATLEKVFMLHLERLAGQRLHAEARAEAAANERQQQDRQSQQHVATIAGASTGSTAAAAGSAVTPSAPIGTVNLSTVSAASVAASVTLQMNTSGTSSAKAPGGDKFGADDLRPTPGQVEQVVAGWIAAAEKSQGQSRIASMALVGQECVQWTDEKWRVVERCASESYTALLCEREVVAAERRSVTIGREEIERLTKSLELEQALNEALDKVNQQNKLRADQCSQAMTLMERDNARRQAAMNTVVSELRDYVNLVQIEVKRKFGYVPYQLVRPDIWSKANINMNIELAEDVHMQGADELLASENSFVAPAQNRRNSLQNGELKNRPPWGSNLNGTSSPVEKSKSAKNSNLKVCAGEDSR